MQRIFGEGRSAASLYTDLANPASNRWYEKIGFQPACDAAHVRRIRTVDVTVRYCEQRRVTLGVGMRAQRKPFMFGEC